MGKLAHERKSTGRVLVPLGAEPFLWLGQHYTYKALGGIATIYEDYEL